MTVIYSTWTCIIAAAMYTFTPSAIIYTIVLYCRYSIIILYANIVYDYTVT